MQKFVKLLALALFLSAIFALGCGSSTMAKVQEPAMWSVPEHTKIALITVDVGKKVMERAPSDYSNMRGILVGSLTAAFGPTVEIVDRTDLGFKQLIAPVQKEAKKLLIFTENTAPTLPTDQVWGAEAPKGLPNGVVEPLTLSVKVLAWTLNNEDIPDGKTTKSVPTARLDLVYSLWTKSGKEVETIRVVNSVNTESHGASTRDLPKREWHASSIHKAQDAFMGDRDKVFKAALYNNCDWYGCPFLAHTIDYSATWNSSDDKYKAAIKLCDEGKWDEAFAAWKAMSDGDPKDGGALFNMGQVKVVQGKESEASELFNKACAIDDRMLHCSFAKGLVEKMAARRNILE